MTRNSALDQRLRLLRQYGWKTRYISEIPGRNSRLDEIQAAILRVKLRHLEVENAKRRALAARYFESLKEAPITLPGVAATAFPVYHQFAIRLEKRDELKDLLQTRGITCGVLYPVPIYQQPAYRDSQLILPHTERACTEVLCLPCHPGLTSGDVDTVSAAILGWRTLA